MLSYVVPARYFVTILNGVFLKGVGFRILWLEVLMLAVYAGFGFRGRVAKNAPEGSVIMRERLLCIIRKEFRQAFREPRMRSMLFMPPLIQLLVFGFAVNLDVDHATSRGWTATAPTRAANCSPAFRAPDDSMWSPTPANDREVQHLLDSNKADLVVRVLPGFERDLAARPQLPPCKF